MSHHYSGPNVGFPRGDARLDLTDLYAFPSPADANRSVLIMNVHPSFSLLSPAPTTPEPFSADAIYEFKIDTNGDAVADIAYRVCFSAFANGKQIAALRRVEGAQATETGNGGRLIEEWPVSMDREALVVEAEDHRFFAGWRSDSFFFDPIGAINDFHFSGKDNFIDKDVCSIVLELPRSALGAKPFGVWARTVDRANGTWI